jgi:hypothetical protein
MNSQANTTEVKQTKITDYFSKKSEKVYGYCNKTGSWHCTSCGANLGPNNPRLLCCKTYCPWMME